MPNSKTVVHFILVDFDFGWCVTILLMVGDHPGELVHTTVSCLSSAAYKISYFNGKSIIRVQMSIPPSSFTQLHLLRLCPLFLALFFPVFSTAYFSHGRRAQFKKPILPKLTGVPKNLSVDPFPDPTGKFWAPWWPF